MRTAMRNGRAALGRTSRAGSSADSDSTQYTVAGTRSAPDTAVAMMAGTPNTAPSYHIGPLAPWVKALRAPVQGNRPAGPRRRVLFGAAAARDASVADVAFD